MPHVCPLGLCTHRYDPQTQHIYSVYDTEGLKTDAKRSAANSQATSFSATADSSASSALKANGPAPAPATGIASNGMAAQQLPAQQQAAAHYPAMDPETGLQPTVRATEDASAAYFPPVPHSSS